jgi:hypothetical protein
LKIPASFFRFCLHGRSFHPLSGDPAGLSPGPFEQENTPLTPLLPALAAGLFISFIGLFK